MLLIDNYDSFAYNLARYFVRLGQSPTVMRNDAVSADDVVKAAPSSIVLSPGPCTPNDAGNCLEIVDAMKQRAPILGVCLGHQVISQVFGAHITRAPSPIHGRSSLIHHTGKGVFAGLPNPMRVGRYHSLIVEATTLPPELEPLATTEDGIVMAFQHVDLPIVGLQFHPESVLTDHGYALLAAFLELAGQPCSANVQELCESDLPRQTATAESQPRTGTEDPGHPVTF